MEESLSSEPRVMEIPSREDGQTHAPPKVSEPPAQGYPMKLIFWSKEVEIRAHLLEGKAPKTVAFTHVVLAEHLELLFRRHHKLTASAFILPGLGNDVAKEALSGLADHLRTHAAAAIVTTHTKDGYFYLVIFPHQAAEWKWFPHLRAGSAGKSELSLFVLADFEDTRLIPTTKDKKSTGYPVKTELGLFKKTMEEQSPKLSDGKALAAVKNLDLFLKKDRDLSRNVFILASPAWAIEKELLTRYCRTIAEATVFQNWHGFVALGNGTIIVHPDFSKHMLNSLPGFWQALVGSFNIFEIGTVPKTGEWSDRPIFTKGRVILLTTDVYEHLPEKALLFIEHLRVYNSRKPSNQRTWKLAVGPHLKTWLIKIAENVRGPTE
jgi:hypothetical protein